MKSLPAELGKKFEGWIFDGWTTESCWKDEYYPDLDGAVKMLGAFTTKAGYWEPHEKMVKIRITIEKVKEEV